MNVFLVVAAKILKLRFKVVMSMTTFRVIYRFQVQGFKKLQKKKWNWKCFISNEMRLKIISRFLSVQFPEKFFLSDQQRLLLPVYDMMCHMHVLKLI